MERSEMWIGRGAVLNPRYCPHCNTTNSATIFKTCMDFSSVATFATAFSISSLLMLATWRQKAPASVLSPLCQTLSTISTTLRPAGRQTVKTGSGSLHPSCQFRSHSSRYGRIRQALRLFSFVLWGSFAFSPCAQVREHFRFARDPMTRSVLLLVCVFALFDATQGNFEAFAASSSSECCSTCIGKTADAAYTYDPVVFSQCSNVTGGVCCFDCGSLGDPSYGDTISYGDDGVTAEVKAGTYISFTWSGVSNVTYISLKTGQKKTVTPTVSDTAATKKSDTFLICAKSAGTIYFRGWGTDTCREASQEHSITVTASDSSTSTCDASDVTVTASSSTGGSSSIEADDTVDSCNAQRASVQVVDGKRTCVCVSDWTNPPECDQWPVWKWLVTVGGGVAALFSIIISVRAFLASRKKKEEEYRNNLAPMGAKSDVETLEVTPDNGYEKTMASYKYDPEADRTGGGTRKPDDREFTL